MTPTPQERTELQRLAEAATPGPWYAEISPYYIVADLVSPVDVCTDQNMKPEDRAFIAAANPAAILDLLSLAAESEELRAELEKERAEREVLDRALADMHAWQAAHKDPIHDLIVAHSEFGALESRYSALEGTRDRLRKAVVWLTGALHDESPEHAGKSHVECDVWECIRARTVLAETAPAALTPKEGE